MSVLVMKFGGASLATPKSFLKVADIVIDKAKEYKHIVVALSAMGKTTNKLLTLAKSINENPSKREIDMLISVGERISISLLSMALHKKGKKSISFTGSQSGIITCENHMDAKIIDVKPKRILEALNENKIVIVAGFQGVSAGKEITTLGRGGSDTSAVALGVALGSKKIEFYKDVDGVYDKDPKLHKDAKLLKELCFEKALKFINKSKHFVLHPRCLKLASDNNVSLIVYNFKNLKKNKNKNYFTIIKKAAFQKVEKNVYEKD